MHKVIGGEFAIGESLLRKNEQEVINIELSSGRCALASILNSINPVHNRILIPNYVCSSVVNTIIDSGFRCVFYEINSDLMFDVEKITNVSDIDAILVINYFGLIKLDSAITRIKTTRPNTVVIEDDVQAFFEYEKSLADYSFTSLRKWFPCSDGAMINTKRDMKAMSYMESKWSQFKIAGNVLKNYANYIDDSVYLGLLEKGEELLEVEYKSLCSETSKIIFSNIELDEVADRRRKNAKFLHDNLEKLCVDHIYEEDSVPLFIPIFIENRDKLRTFFFKDNIFTPVHWPVSEELTYDKSSVYLKELSLICDQRYDIADMERQVDILKEFLDSEEGLFENTDNR